jgi:ketosteroid isomerase-like protein
MRTAIALAILTSAYAAQSRPASVGAAVIEPGATPREARIPPGHVSQSPMIEPLPSIALPPAVARVLTDYEAGWRAKDAAALARLFAHDRVVVPNACPPVRGRQRVAECYAGSGGPLFLRAVAYGTDAGLGYIVGAYRDSEDGPDQGKFTLTLTKGADGRWLIVADMDRSYPPR